MTRSISKICLIASSVVSLSGVSGAAVLLQDNFTFVDGGTGTNDLNNNLAGRQAGSPTTYSWSKTNGTQADSQIGNGSTNVGQADVSNPNYMLLAFAGAATNSLALSSTTVSGPLMISFDMYIAPNETDRWVAFTLTSSATSNGFPTVGADNFAFLLKSNATNTLEVFANSNSSTAVSGLAAGSGASFSMMISDASGTGSGFAGNGSRVQLYRGNTLIGVYNPGNLTTEYMTFRAYNGLSGIDNLLVQTVPEPTAAAVLGSLGVLGLVRRRRFSASV